MSLTTLLHSITMILLHLIRTQNGLDFLQPLTLRYILFGSYGIVIGLWSTIAFCKELILKIKNQFIDFCLDCICNSTKRSSSSTFAQSLALRFLGRIIAYTCTLFLCQSFLYYINSICLLCIFSFIFICYRCCN